MDSYSFADRQVADRLKRFANRLPGLMVDQPPRVTEIYLFKTPSGGIPAASGGTYGKAVCEAYYPSYDGTDATEMELLDGSGSVITDTVFNKSSSPVPGDIVIQVMICYGLFLENWTDCNA